MHPQRPLTPDPLPATTDDGPGPALEAVIAQLCGHLGADADQTVDIVAGGCLRIEGVDFALRVNEANQHLEFFGDCGLPSAWEQADLFRHLLEEALSNDLPALCFARHPVSGHVVAKGSLALAGLDPGGWLLLGLIVASLTRIKELRARFALLSYGDS